MPQDHEQHAQRVYIHSSCPASTPSNKRAKCPIHAMSSSKMGRQSHILFQNLLLLGPGLQDRANLFSTAAR